MLSKMESRQLNKFRKKAKRASRKGKTFIDISAYYSSKVYEEIQKMGYTIEPLGSWDDMLNRVHFPKAGGVV